MCPRASPTETVAQKIISVKPSSRGDQTSTSPDIFPLCATVYGSHRGGRLSVLFEKDDVGAFPFFTLFDGFQTARGSASSLSSFFLDAGH